VTKKESAQRDARLVSTANDACEIVALIASVLVIKPPLLRKMAIALSVNLVSLEPSAI